AHAGHDGDDVPVAELALGDRETGAFDLVECEFARQRREFHGHSAHKCDWLHGDSLSVASAPGPMRSARSEGDKGSTVRDFPDPTCYKPRSGRSVGTDRSRGPTCVGSGTTGRAERLRSLWSQCSAPALQSPLPVPRALLRVIRRTPTIRAVRRL